MEITFSSPTRFQKPFPRNENLFGAYMKLTQYCNKLLKSYVLLHGVLLKKEVKARIYHVSTKGLNNRDSAWWTTPNLFDDRGDASLQLLLAVALSS